MFAEYNQEDATFLNLFISVRRATCFRRVFRPSWSLKLHIQCQVFVRPLLIPAASLARLASCYTFNLGTIFVQIYALNREFRHNLASSCRSISEFMKIFFYHFISVGRKQKHKDITKLKLIIFSFFL